jgi:hypothetical protein
VSLLPFSLRVAHGATRVDALYLSNTPAWQSSTFRNKQHGAESSMKEKHGRSKHTEGEAEGMKTSQQSSARTSYEPTGADAV